MQLVDGQVASIMQVLDFMDAPLYWKFIITSSWGGRESGLVDNCSTPRFCWFLAPNAERIRLSTDLDGVEVMYFLRGEQGTGGVMRMNLCELVVERRSAAAEFVDETPEPGRCGLAPEVPVGLSRRLDLLYSEFCTLSRHDGSTLGDKRSSELARLRDSVNEMRADVDRTLSRLSGVLGADEVIPAQVEVVPQVEVAAAWNADDTGDVEATETVFTTQSGRSASTGHKRGMSDGIESVGRAAKVSRSGSRLAAGSCFFDSSTTVTSDVTDGSWTVESAAGGDSTHEAANRLGAGRVARV